MDAKDRDWEWRIILYILEGIRCNGEDLFYRDNAIENVDSERQNGVRYF